MFLPDLRIFSPRSVLKNDVAPAAAPPAEAAGSERHAWLTKQAL